MQVKKFEAPTIQEALDTIKRELGPEAIILQTKRNKRGFGLLSKPSVEVTAAVSERSMQKKSFVETRLPPQSKEVLGKMGAQRQADLLDKYTERHLERAKNTKDRVQLSGAAKKAPQAQPNSQKKTLTATRYIDISDPGENRAIEAPKTPSAAVQNAAAANAATGRLDSATRERSSLEDELRTLKALIQEMKTSKDDAPPVTGAQSLMGSEALGTAALQDAFEQLIVSGVDRRYALNLVRKAAIQTGTEDAKNGDVVADQLALSLMETTEVLSPLNGLEAGKRGGGPAVMALVGPTGVGKTTTVAKIASEALLKRNLKVGLINLDSYKVAAFDQLGTYAKILNVPFRSVSTLEELKAAVQEFQALDLVLIDTAGRSQRDAGTLKEMHDIVQAIPNVRTQLVLSATTRDTELYDTTHRFAMFRPEGLIFSKLDETTVYGAVFNVSQKAKLPLLYFTTGQRVPEDIEEASKERVAALIMNL